MRARVVRDSRRAGGEKRPFALPRRGAVEQRERFGEETARRAKAFAFTEMGADVVTVWCEPGLVDWYVERCGFTREAPMGRASDDDGGDVCCRAFASAHVRARYEAVRVGA